MGKKFTAPSQSLDINGQIIVSEEEIAKVFAEQFQAASSSQNYSREFIKHKENTENQLNFKEYTTSAYNRHFSIEEFECSLSNMKNTSPGGDNIPYELIKQLPMSSKLILLDLYNKIWTSGMYPEKWREAIIIPIPKQGKDRRLPSSHRPISLTCCMSKLLEKMVSCRLMWLLETQELLTPSQAGFRRYRSTLDQLTCLEKAIQDSFATRNHLIAIFFDLEKAYDTTWRYNILKTLFDWGIRGNLPTFIHGFLKDRKFCVRNGHITSRQYKLENGIPQGSTLSVILFAIAVNKLLDGLNPSIGRSLYVDDLAIFYAAPITDNIQQTLQESINILVNNANKLGFRFSTTKTQCVHFCRLRSEHNDPVLRLYGRIIQCKDTVRFLGLVLDRKLNWGPHIEDLAVRCKRALNTVRALSSINWGCNRDILLRLYKTLIMAKMDYGCTVYASARPSKLKILDSIQATVLRLALGAFRTSPFLSMCSEASIPPLKYRREQLLCSYGSKIWAQPNHVNYHSLFDEEEYLVYEGRRTITRPVGVRLKELLTTNNLILPSVYKLGYCEVPPWEIITPKIHLECLQYPKGESNRNIIHTEIIRIIRTYSESQVIYTDGSKTEQGTGSAFTYLGVSYSWTLPKEASIYTAELYAIWQALRHIETCNHNTYLICSDSLSSIQALRDTNTRDPLVQRSLAFILRLQHQHKTICFVWIPSHVGIKGNEIADRMAKLAANEEIREDIPIRPDDVKMYLKHKVLERWQHEWDNKETKLRAIKPKVNTRTTLTGLTRREQVVTTRLRIGHTNMTSIHMLRGDRQPICENCRTSLTVPHILLQCPLYSATRQQFQIPQELRTCLGDDSRTLNNLIQFLRRIEIFTKI